MRPRRFVTAALLAGIALLTTAPSAWADSPQGGWTDPSPSGQIDGVPVAVVESKGLLRGVAEFSEGIAAVTFGLKQDATPSPDDPCSASSQVEPQQKAGGGSTRVEFAFKARFPCNRRYEVSATVSPVQRLLRPASDLTLDLFVDVAIPPAATTGVDATVAGRRVALTWDEADHEPDFEGFAIRRATGDGPFTPLGELGPDATSYTDSTVPGGGGTFHYRVIGIRSGPEGGTVVYGPNGPTADAVVVPVPGGTVATAAAVADGGGSAGSTGGGGSDGGGAVLPSGSGTQSVHRVFQVPGRRTATTLDTGFQQTLPFGSKPVAAPGDSSAIARFDDGSGDDGKRQTLLLVAGGAAALSWAMVLRFVSRRAAGV